MAGAGEAGGAVVATAAIAPLHRDASVRAEQVSQLVLGETAVVLERRGEWIGVRTDIDHYSGWVHEGYVRVFAQPAAAAWHAAAGAWSEGTRVAVGADVVSLPLRARVQLEDTVVTLPDGRAGRSIEGALRPVAAVTAAARKVAPEEWALDHFRGAPYQWGGLTPWGVDCSGLVQTTFAARGTALPRDSAQQALIGSEVGLDCIQPGDLLFFRSEQGEHITHVAFAAPGESLVHSTIACGGVVHEPFTGGSRADRALRPRLVSARRIEVRP